MNSAWIIPVITGSYESELGYNRDVMILTDHCYTGIGRSCETLAEAIQYSHEYNCKEILCWDKDRARNFALYDELPPYMAWLDRTPISYDWSL